MIMAVVSSDVTRNMFTTNSGLRVSKEPFITHSTMLTIYITIGTSELIWLHDIVSPSIVGFGGVGRTERDS